MSNVQSVLTTALTLSPTERIQLIRAIWETIPAEELPPLDAEWTSEIRRRYADYQAGLEKPIPWEQARAEALQRAGLRVPDASR